MIPKTACEQTATQALNLIAKVLRDLRAWPGLRQEAIKRLDAVRDAARANDVPALWRALAVGLAWFAETERRFRAQKEDSEVAKLCFFCRGALESWVTHHSMAH